MTFECRYKGKGRDPRFSWAVKKLWKDVENYTYCDEKECLPYIEGSLDAFLSSKRMELNTIKLPDGNDYTVFLNREIYNVYSPPDANMFASLISDIVNEVGLKYETTGIVLQGYAAENKFFRESFNQFDPVSDETQEFRSAIRNYILKQLLGSAPVVKTECLSNGEVRGEVYDNGGSMLTERGVCWSVNHEPNIRDSHILCDSSNTSFVMNLIGLSQGKTYYVRAYAVNSIGVGYGNEVEIMVPLDDSGREEVVKGESKKSETIDPNDDGKRKFNMSYTLSNENRKQFLTVEAEIFDGKALPFDCVFTIASRKLLKLKQEEALCEKCGRTSGSVLKFGPYSLPIDEVGPSKELFAQIWPADKNKSVNLFKNNTLKIVL